MKLEGSAFCSFQEGLEAERCARLGHGNGAACDGEAQEFVAVGALQADAPPHARYRIDNQSQSRSPLRVHRCRLFYLASK
jgi:hypothetical protein